MKVSAIQAASALMRYAYGAAGPGFWESHFGHAVLRFEGFEYFFTLQVNDLTAIDECTILGESTEGDQFTQWYEELTDHHFDLDEIVNPWDLLPRWAQARIRHMWRSHG